jgi:hypothetical protein
MGAWLVERVVHFEPGDALSGGLAHFGFHVRTGEYYAIAHQRHWMGRVGATGELAWTAGAAPFRADIPNIAVDLDYPMFVDVLRDGSLVVSNLGSARLIRIDPRAGVAGLLVDGRGLGMADMGNAVVDRDGFVWVNEVVGRRLWRFHADGRQDLVLGDGKAGFQSGTVGFGVARFNWIYDIRRGPDDRIFVLDSTNFALRVVDPVERTVTTVAGTGSSGPAHDGPALEATFGSDPSAAFDGPISLAVDEAGNAYVGDRQNHVVREIDAATGWIRTIAGQRTADDTQRNDPGVRDPFRLNLPQISSLDYADGRLYVPTDLAGGRGDLVILRRAEATRPGPRPPVG